MMRSPKDRMMRAGRDYGVRKRPPGTLTVRYGDETVTLDSSSSPEKFKADKARVGALLARMLLGGR